MRADDADKMTGRASDDRSSATPSDTSRDASGHPLPDELDFAELMRGEAGAVFQLMVDQCRDRLDPVDPANARFYQWYAWWARERRTEAERAASKVDAKAFVQRIKQRLQAEAAAGRARVREMDGVPYEVTGTALPASAERPATSVALYDMAVAAGVGRELWDEPCVGYITVPDDLPRAPYVALKVKGESMMPLIQTGDVMLMRLGSELVRGSVIVARHPENGYVVKQIGSVTDDAIELTSLNAAFAPMFIPNDGSLVLGTVVLRWRATDGGGA